MGRKRIHVTVEEVAYDRVLNRVVKMAQVALTESARAHWRDANGGIHEKSAEQRKLDAAKYQTLVSVLVDGFEWERTCWRAMQRLGA